MTLPVGPQNLGSVLKLVNALQRDAFVFSRSNVSGTLDLVASRRIDDSATKLHATTTNALQAVEELGLDPSASAPLRAVLDGATLVNASLDQRVAFGRHVRAAAVETRSLIATQYRVDGLLDGMLEDPIRARAALRERLEQRPCAVTAEDLLTIRRLVEAADVGAGAPGLACVLQGKHTFDNLVDASLAGWRVRPSDVDLYAETWLARLSGDTSTDDRRLAAIQQIVTRRPSELTAREWSRLRVLADADQRSAKPIITQDLPSVGTSLDELLAGFADGAVYEATAQVILGTWRTDIGLGFAVPEAMALGDGELPAHAIRRSDVERFLQGSAWTYPVFHGNSDDATYLKIVRTGASVEANKRGVYGQGFYTAIHPGGWGDTTMEVAVRVEHPFITTEDAIFRAFQAAAPDVAWGDKRAVREALVAAGYDGILMLNRWEDGPDWLIALQSDKIRVIVEDAPDAPDVRVPTPRRIDRDAVAANLRAAVGESRSLEASLR